MPYSCKTALNMLQNSVISQCILLIVIITLSYYYLIIISYYHYITILNLLTRLGLDFMVNQKIHKPGIPIRPIVAYSGSPWYNLSKYILNMLKMKITMPRILLHFSKYIRNVPIEDGKIMVPFDVTSLYTSIFIIDTLNIIQDYVDNDDQFTRKTAIP